MRSKSIAVAILALALFLGTSSARASIVTLTYTGIVTSGEDDTGVFGKISPNLYGAFSAVYVFNTNIGIKGSNFVYGGSSVGVPTPAISSSITINGISAYINGSFQASFSQGPASVDQVYNSADVYDLVLGSQYPDNQLFIIVYGPDGALPQSIDRPFQYQDSTGIGFGSFHIFTADEHTYGSLRPTSVAETISGVPEPCTWAMMLLGFGGLGALAYQSKRTKPAELAAA